MQRPWGRGKVGVREEQQEAAEAGQSRAVWAELRPASRIPFGLLKRTCDCFIIFLKKGIMSSHIPQIRNPNQGLDWEMPGGRDLCRARPPRAGRLPCRTRGGRGCQPGREAVPVSCNSSHKYVSQAGRGVQPRTRRALSVPLGLPGPGPSSARG